jgi:hypothetical protein
VNLNDTNLLGAVADALGNLKAEKANLAGREDSLKAELIDAAAQGTVRAFEGAEFRATVTFGNRSVTDWRAVVDELSVGHSLDFINKLIAKHTEMAEGVPTVRISGRKGA